MTRAPRVIFGFVLVGLLALVPAACSGGDDGEKASGATTTTTDDGITEEQAIEIALKAWKERESSFDADEVRPSVQRVKNTFDVALVPAVIEGPGGEPHVVVDRSTGEVTEIYQTK